MSKTGQTMTDYSTVDVSPREGLWQRLRYTPLGDLLRGRVTARLDLRRVIADCDLPQPAAALVYYVTRKTRLWHREQLQVAQELAGHFADGLSAGRSPEQLIETFGDVHLAARLIRRARKRGRPMAWHVMRWTSLTLITLILLAILLVAGSLARAVLTSPVVSRNYLEEYEQRNARLPDDERAWPLYREAMAGLLPLSEPMKSLIGDELPRRASDPRWDELVAEMGKRQEALALIREAAQRPHLGFLYLDPANKIWLDSIGWTPEQLQKLDVPYIETLLPYTHELRTAMWLLVADTWSAAGEEDAPRVMATLVAMLAMAEHARDSVPCAVTELVRFAIINSTYHTIGELLVLNPDLLSDAELAELAHRLAAIGGGGDLKIDYTGERHMMVDTVQRIYSDNGRGNGYLTQEGWKFLMSLASSAPPDDHWIFRYATTGPMGLALADRAETEAIFDEILTLMEAEAAKPYWQQARPSPATIRLDDLHQSHTSRLRYLPVVLLAPAVEAMTRAAEMTTQERDATLVALALTLYHRRHGEWPRSLDALVPDLLPAVPADRYTGEPLKYRLIEGEPVVYSVGPDLKDNDGRPVELSLHHKRSLHPRPRSADDDGDWVLWPPRF